VPTASWNEVAFVVIVLTRVTQSTIGRHDRCCEVDRPDQPPKVLEFGVEPIQHARRALGTKKRLPPKRLV
jgi:hypothetical protein